MMKQILKNLILREKAGSAQYIKHLRKLGVQIGENVRFYSPAHTVVDVSCPWLVSIGNNVCITHGVIILSHDYAWAVLKQHSSSAGAVLGAQSPVKIGNNVFIGMNAVITRGVTIGDHVIIGTGSVVTSDCESGYVYAGNPARKLMSVEEYGKKRKEKQFAEAKTLVHEYQAKFGTLPKKEVLSEYFMLFSTAAEATENPSFATKMKTGGNYDESVAYLQENPPLFDSYKSFLEACIEPEVV